MALSKLKNLYQAVIADHYKTPHNRGSLESVTNRIELRNPTCGDVINLDLEVVDGRIIDAKFVGEGCAISIASASMMTDIIKGMTVAEVLETSDDFSLMMLNKSEDIKDKKRLGEAIAFEGVSKFPARIKCATLGWKAAEKAIENEEDGDQGAYDIEELEGE